MSDLFDVSQEVILVTGASQGLGRQFARVLSAHGAAVALAARQTVKLKKPRGRDSRARRPRPSRFRWMSPDLASIASAIDSAEGRARPGQRADQHAGIAIEKLAVDQTEADWDSVINANLKGAYFAATENRAADDRAQAGRQYRQHRLGARFRG